MISALTSIKFRLFSIGKMHCSPATIGAPRTGPASLRSIETCKLHGVDPQAYIADVLTRLVNLWPASRLDDLMPWAWAAERSATRQAA
jgi:hypothetical protein